MEGQRDWEARLAAEGLAVVLPGSAVSSKVRAMGRGGRNYTAEAMVGEIALTNDCAGQMGAYVAAVERWQTWAETVLATHDWRNRHQRRVWELYAGCTPMRDIPALVSCRRRDRRDGQGSSRASVERIIAAVNAAYPDRPRNPWSSPVTVAAAGEIATPPPARSLPPEAARALEAVYTPPERKTTVMMKTYHYDLIMFSRRKSIPIPGREIANDRLLKVEGTPHAGGIDVLMGGKCITISWDSISHTVRDAEPATAVK